MTITLNGSTGITNASGGTVLDTTSDLGWGQTWQNVAASRAAGTSYQNTTSRPIMVVVAGTKSTGTRRLEISTDDATWIELGSVSSDPGGSAVSGIVPVDNYYRITSGITVYAWAELR